MKSVIACAMALLAAGPARAAETFGNPCAQRNVLDLVERHFGRQVAQLDLIPDSAIEIRVSGNRVTCAVSVRVADPDLIEPRYFEVRAVNGGVSVDFGGR